MEKRTRNSLKLEILFANFFRVVMIGSIAVSVLEKNYLNVLTAVCALGLSYLPFILRRRRYLYLPVDFQVMIIVFFFASMYLGSIRGYYLKYWWWDIMVHTSSGFLLGLIGFLLVYTLNKHKGDTVSLSPFFVALFSFSFAITIGSIWEIYEFTMDSVFGFNMQKSGLVDTMWDMIVDMIGASLSSIYGYFHVKEHMRRSRIKKRNRKADIIDEIYDLRDEEEK